ncbi:sensor histidine kinase [Streptomyces virginiae]|uniref:sensor histidine kinase n=1 Tax=Streptomyces virginiae TaxID=1961 RepID=UPI0037175479
MMHGQDLPTLLEQVREDFGLEAVSLLERDTGHAAEPRWYVVASTGADPPERPYDADVDSCVGDDLTLAARGHSLSSDDQRVLGACAAQLGMAYSHGRLAAHDAESGLRAEAEHTRASLLLTASRDLRGPLRTADEALDGLGVGTDTRESRALSIARSSVRRAVQLVSDLDELSRLHAGALDLYLRPVDLDELLTAVLDDLGPGGHTIRCSLPEQLPDVIADAAVLTRVLTALAAEAQSRSPPDRPARLTGKTWAGQVEIRMTDGTNDAVQGAERGTHPSRTPDSLTLRMCRDLTETMGGTLETAAVGPGLAVTLALPAAASRRPITPSAPSPTGEQ